VSRAAGSGIRLEGEVDVVGFCAGYVIGIAEVIDDGSGVVRVTTGGESVTAGIAEDALFSGADATVLIKVRIVRITTTMKSRPRQQTDIIPRQIAYQKRNLLEESKKQSIIRNVEVNYRTIVEKLVKIRNHKGNHKGNHLHLFAKKR